MTFAGVLLIFYELYQVGIRVYSRGTSLWYRLYTSVVQLHRSYIQILVCSDFELRQRMIDTETVH